MDATPSSGGMPEGSEPGGSGAFAVGYRSNAGDMLVYGGGVITIVGVLGAVFKGHPGFLLVSLAGSVMALYFHPTLNHSQPQLGADANGLFIARLGIVPWSAVRQMRVEHRALRTMTLATLVVTTDGPIREAVVHPDTVPLTQRFASRNANVSGNKVRVALHTLAMDPVEIEQRLEAFYRAAKL